MSANHSSSGKERVALITGANIGIGRVTALRLAQQGYTVFLAGRSPERTQAVIDEIHALTGNPNSAFFLPLLLDDLNSVRECAALFWRVNCPCTCLSTTPVWPASKGKPVKASRWLSG